MTNDGSYTYAYNAEGQLNATAGVNYSYDGDGRRVKKDNGTLYWYGLGGQVLMESDLAGNWQREHVYLGGARIAYRYSTGAIRYLFGDHLGTARVMTSSTGVIEQESDYYPFGGERIVTNTVPNTYKFTGKERDTETGNDYFGARYNASNLGRFMSPDPLLNSGRPWNPQTWNRYPYTLNNPLKFTDPTGLYNLVNNCAQDDERCNRQFKENAKRLRQALENLRKEVTKVKDPTQKARLEAALKALGTEDNRNNVNVSFGTLPEDAAGNTVTMYDEKTGALSFNVTFDPSKISSRGGQAIDAAHEGTHVADISDPRFADRATTLEPFQWEYRGYQTSAWAAQALGVSPLAFRGNVIWNTSWGKVDRVQLMDRGITNYLTTRPINPLTEVRPHNPWPD